MTASGALLRGILSSARGGASTLLGRWGGGGQGQLAPPCLSQPGSLGQLSQAWPLHCRSVYRPREAALSRSMELYSNAPPAALGIPPKLLPRDPEASVAGAYPYGAAAQELGLLVLECCPQKKLDCIGERGVVTSLGEVGRGRGHNSHAPVPTGNQACVPPLSYRSSSWQTGCVP